MTVWIVLFGLMILASIAWIPGPGPFDYVVRSDFHRERLFPYRIYTTARKWGYDTACDPEFPPCPDPNPLPIFRRRQIDGFEYCFARDPLSPPPEGPAEMGRIYLRKSGTPGGAQSQAPPKIHTLWWRPVRACDVEVADVSTCDGGKVERGQFFRGDVSRTLRRDSQNNVQGPPRWGLYQNYTAETSGGGNGKTEALDAPDILEADNYRYILLASVPPVSAWNPQPPYSVPYPDGAENDFLFNDTFTYSVPCYARHAPWRYTGGSLSPAPVIPAGLRAIAGMSSGAPDLALLKHYSARPGCGANYGFFPTYMNENFIRTFHAKTATTRYEWTDDPDSRGWWVEYTARLDAWLVHNYSWVWSGVRGLSPDQGGFWPRWNAWYEGEVTAVINGDKTDSGFKAFIESQDSQYGLTFRPRNSHCNDCFKECLGQPWGLGDVICPETIIQDSCQSVGPTPCVNDGYSWWYVPVAPVAANVPTSQHPILGVPQYPETGLIHAIERTMLDPGGKPSAGTQFGWATLWFTATVPWLLGG